MFALFFDNGTWVLDSMVNKGLKEYTSKFNIHSQHFDHVKKKDTKLRQILVNHHIATSQGKPPNLKREI